MLNDDMYKVVWKLFLLNNQKLGYHFFYFFGAALSFLPASFSVVATGAWVTATATGVNNPCLLCCSVALIAPESASCLRTSLAIDPTTLNFSITWDVEMCFPSLGIPWIRRSWVALSTKTAWSTFSLAFPLVHF